MTNATTASASQRDVSSVAVPASSHVSSMGGRASHTVQFYEDDAFLRARVAHFLREGLEVGEPAIVIATEPHIEAFRGDLSAQGVDVAKAEAAGRLVWLDARETLTELMEDRSPSERRFYEVIGRVIDRLTSQLPNRHPPAHFRAYGEMVDLLCQDGNTSGALRLEELWNALAKKHSFALLCGYAMDRFATADDTSSIEQVCATHTHVFGAADGTEPAAIDDTRREIVQLRQRARALESEIEYRKQLERELRRSKRELEEFFETAAEGIHRVAADGTILWANGAELDLLGYQAEEYVGHPIAEFHVDADVIDDMLRRLARNETLVNHEARLRCKDGSIRHVVINSNVLRQDGNFVHTRCFTRDITERKQAEDALRFLSEASAVIASSLDYEATLATVCRMCVPLRADWAFIDVKVDGAIKRVAVAHADPAKVALAHRLWEHVQGRFESPHGPSRVIRTGEAEVLAKIDDSILVGAIADADLLEAARGLGLRSSLCVPLRVGKETIGAITFIAAESRRTFDARDVALAEELAGRASVAVQHARLYQDAQVATRMKDEFLATVSHELRTPLNAILGWARMLRSGSLGADKVERALDAIERNSLSQVQLIEDLLDVSRIISGKLRLDVQQITLPLVVDAAIDSVQHAIEAKNIHFQHIVDPNAGPIIGDAHRIQQVIWNLLSNAVKFTPKGGAVRLIVERVDSSVQLTVTDTGQGIPKHLLPSIFERFRQADGSTVRVHGGLGLGLAIVRHIVDLHGGSVQAHSEGEGRGTTFVVRLPVSPLRQEVLGPFRHPVHADLRPAFEPPRELQGLTVLVVDDEADTRELLTEVLEQCGCSVLKASGAREAIDVLDHASPRVVVCDIGMPGMDGYAFIELVRKRPADQGGRVVAVALTAYASVEDRRRALRAGYQMHLAKPVEPAELVAVLANLAQLAIAMS